MITGFCGMDHGRKCFSDVEQGKMENEFLIGLYTLKWKGKRKPKEAKGKNRKQDGKEWSGVFNHHT